MGLKNPVGTPVTWWDNSLTVIGAVEDMVMESPYDEPKPLIYTRKQRPWKFCASQIECINQRKKCNKQYKIHIQKIQS
jgi:hypothetical protein